MWSELNIPEHDISIIFNTCFSAIWLTGVACILYLTYRFIREYSYVTVNCWFCNTDVKVPFRLKNDWFCTHCQQFNGFNKDGDYSKPIPEQYNENLNIKCVTAGRKSSRVGPSNGLCRICNANQELKIKQIALYVPFREEEYDKEIEQFKKKLEKSYKLCSICERTVQNTLKLKSNLYSSRAPRINENNFRRASTSELIQPGSYKYHILSILTAVLVVFILNYYNFINVNNFMTDDIEKLKKEWQNFPQINYDVVVNVTLTICAILSINLFCGRTILGSILCGFIACATNNHITLNFKTGVIFAFLIYFGYKYEKRTKSAPRFEKLSNNYKQHNTKRENNDDSTPNSNFPVYSNRENTNPPLCGKFSGLTLGQPYSVSTRSHTSSYLFKSNKRLIQPAKLKLEDIDNPSDTNCSSPTVSSGYESINSFIRRSPDSVSEFDSISQVENYHCNFIRQKPNALSKYYYPYNSCLPAPDLYYGVSPICSAANQSNTSCNSQTETNAFFSAVQIFLCSLGFFILGFSFQFLVTCIKF